MVFSRSTKMLFVLGFLAWLSMLTLECSEVAAGQNFPFAKAKDFLVKHGVVESVDSIIGYVQWQEGSASVSVMIYDEKSGILRREDFFKMFTGNAERWFYGGCSKKLAGFSSPSSCFIE